MLTDMPQPDGQSSCVCASQKKMNLPCALQRLQRPAPGGPGARLAMPAAGLRPRISAGARDGGAKRARQEVTQRDAAHARRAQCRRQGGHLSRDLRSQRETLGAC